MGNDKEWDELFSSSKVTLSLGRSMANCRLLIWAWTALLLPSSRLSGSLARGEPLNGSQDATGSVLLLRESAEAEAAIVSLLML